MQPLRIIFVLLLLSVKICCTGTGAIEKLPVNLFIPAIAHAATYPSGNLDEIRTIDTTEQALSFSFSGITNEAVVRQMLDQLDDMGITATFFIFELEMRRHPELVREIMARGHELGIAINVSEAEGFSEVQNKVKLSMQKLEQDFGVKTELVKQPWSVVEPETKRAVSELGYYLIGQSVSVIQTSHKDYTSEEQVMSDLFKSARYSLGRGDIVHARMDYYTDDTLLGRVITAIKKEKIDNIAFSTPYDNPRDNPSNDSWYVIKPVGEVLFNEKYTYKYPFPLEDVPEDLRSEKSNYVKLDKHDFNNELEKRYIGAPAIRENGALLGFSSAQMRRLDTTGTINTDENVVFFTFDDWGTDAAVNKLLYVLRKHNVKATFFIITHTVQNNKNLLRAIAEEGHDIGNHTDTHTPMAVRKPLAKKYTQQQSKEEYFEEMNKSYKILRDTVGDIVVDGQPALTRFFRPPALALSKDGIEALFEAGFEYIVSGSESTTDYKVDGVYSLIKEISNGIYDEDGNLIKGAILVMHMTDHAAYTSIAVDLALTANAQKDDSDKTKFKTDKLSNYISHEYQQKKK